MLTQLCNICGRLPYETETKRLVRDHSHATGLIRGILCDLCNNYIGVYESLKVWAENTKRKNKRYKIWLNRFYYRIIYHLTCNTDIMYFRIK